MTLSVLNAAALVALVAFHFHSESTSEHVAVEAQPHYMMKQSPRFATLPAQHSEAILANNSDEQPPVAQSERWVF